MTTWTTATPFEISSYDNPETIRFRKYATGTNLVVHGTEVEAGLTPKEVVWQRGEASLYHYEPGREKKYPVPILIVYAPILRPYILDLVPGNSFVEYLLAEGFDVYLLDWGNAGPEDKHLSFEDWILDYMPEAVEGVLRDSGAEGLTIFGYCQGGTMSVMYASLFPEEHLKNLILLTTPTDFAPEDPRIFGLWTLWTRNSEHYFDPDSVVNAFGNFPEDFFKRLNETWSSVLGPLPDLAGSYAKTWDRVMPDKTMSAWLAVSKWVDDGKPFPGEAFRQWIRDFYQQNKLPKGEIELRGQRVDLSNIECPLLNIAGSKDFICPVAQAEATMDLVGSRDKEFVVLDAGHVGLMAGPVAKEELWPRVRDWLEPRSK
ncbi:MAG: alpha/beta fold hydrolase [Actinomycetota bacterium]|nr:alpha/beta fold hydrolase [Actinomycetota bacterium]